VRQHRRRVGAVEKGVDRDVGTVFHNKKRKKTDRAGDSNIEDNKFILSETNRDGVPRRLEKLGKRKSFEKRLVFV
jgi:hypothetical protein